MGSSNAPAPGTAGQAASARPSMRSRQRFTPMTRHKQPKRPGRAIAPISGTRQIVMAVNPPSTRTIDPVTKEAARGEAR